MENNKLYQHVFEGRISELLHSINESILSDESTENFLAVNFSRILSAYYLNLPLFIYPQQHSSKSFPALSEWKNKINDDETTIIWLNRKKFGQCLTPECCPKLAVLLLLRSSLYDEALWFLKQLSSSKDRIQVAACLQLMGIMPTCLSDHLNDMCLNLCQQISNVSAVEETPQLVDSRFLTFLTVCDGLCTTSSTKLLTHYLIGLMHRIFASLSVTYEDYSHALRPPLFLLDTCGGDRESQSDLVVSVCINIALTLLHCSNRLKLMHKSMIEQWLRELRGFCSDDEQYWHISEALLEEYWAETTDNLLSDSSTCSCIRDDNVLERIAEVVMRGKLRMDFSSAYFKLLQLDDESSKRTLASVARVYQLFLPKQSQVELGEMMRALCPEHSIPEPDPHVAQASLMLQFLVLATQDDIASLMTFMQYIRDKYYFAMDGKGSESLGLPALCPCHSDLWEQRLIQQVPTGDQLHSTDSETTWLLHKIGMSDRRENDGICRKLKVLRLFDVSQPDLFLQLSGNINLCLNLNGAELLGVLSKNRLLQSPVSERIEEDMQAKESSTEKNLNKSLETLSDVPERIVRFAEPQRVDYYRCNFQQLSLTDNDSSESSGSNNSINHPTNDFCQEQTVDNMHVVEGLQLDVLTDSIEPLAIPPIHFESSGDPVKSWETDSEIESIPLDKTANKMSQQFQLLNIGTIPNFLDQTGTPPVEKQPSFRLLKIPYQKRTAEKQHFASLVSKKTQTRKVKSRNVSQTTEGTQTIDGVATEFHSVTLPVDPSVQQVQEMKQQIPRVQEGPHRVTIGVGTETVNKKSTGVGTDSKEQKLFEIEPTDLNWSFVLLRDLQDPNTCMKMY